MEKKTYTADELDHASRDELIGIISSLQGTIVRMAQNQDPILEQAALLRQQCWKLRPMKRMGRWKSRNLRKCSSAGKKAERETRRKSERHPCHSGPAQNDRRQTESRISGWEI